MISFYTAIQRNLFIVLNDGYLHIACILKNKLFKLLLLHLSYRIIECVQVDSYINLVMIVFYVKN